MEVGSARSSAWLVWPLVCLFAFSTYLALHRIFQVDEVEYVFIARLLATNRAGEYVSSANLVLLGPMTWIAARIGHAAPLLRAERLLFLSLFWLNLYLIVRCAGFRVGSRTGLFALLLVATLAPLCSGLVRVGLFRCLLVGHRRLWKREACVCPSARAHGSVPPHFGMIAQTTLPTPDIDVGSAAGGRAARVARKPRARAAEVDRESRLLVPTAARPWCAR